MITRERPILFSAPMVREIRADRKWQTRRLLGLREFGPSTTPGFAWTFRDRRLIWNDYTHKEFLASKWCRYHVGDRLWVKETHARFAVGEGLDRPVQECVAYRATSDSDGGVDYTNGRGEVMHHRVTKWTPSIFMPRWASRIQLEVTEVRVQRLQDISEDDARAEGVDEVKDKVPTARDAFRLLWESINGDRAPWTSNRAPWASNPWVFAVSFRRLT